MRRPTERKERDREMERDLHGDAYTLTPQPAPVLRELVVAYCTQSLHTACNVFPLTPCRLRVQQQLDSSHSTTHRTPQRLVRVAP